MAEAASQLHLVEIAPAVASVMTLGDPAACGRLFETVLGLSLPSPGRRSDGHGKSAIAVAPGRYLVMEACGGDDFVPSLTERARGIAAVTDQSDGLRSFHLFGPGAAELLQQCVAIDLHPSRFPVGAAITTMIGLMRVHVSRMAPSGEGDAAYEVSVARSLADSLICHLREQGPGRHCVHVPLASRNPA